MSTARLDSMDLSAWEQPDPEAGPRALMEGWFEYQRHEFQRKLRDLSADQLVAWAIPSVDLSVLGLVRHMTQLEHVYGSWGLGGGDRVMVYGYDDYVGGDEYLRG